MLYVFMFVQKGCLGALGQMCEVCGVWFVCVRTWVCVCVSVCVCVCVYVCVCAREAIARELYKLSLDWNSVGLNEAFVLILRA